MARPNFKFEKRQKELAKQKKAEEKRLRRLEKRSGATGDEPAEQPETNAPVEPVGDDSQDSASTDID